MLWKALESYEIVNIWRKGNLKIRAKLSAGELTLISKLWHKSFTLTFFWW